MSGAKGYSASRIPSRSAGRHPRPPGGTCGTSSARARSPEPANGGRGVSISSFAERRAGHYDAVQPREWCGRPGSNRHSSFEPRDFRTTSAFAASPWRVRAVGSFVVWTIPSPWRLRALGAARLVSTPSRRPFDRSAWLGIACYRFPRLWAVLHLGFPRGHSMS